MNSRVNREIQYLLSGGIFYGGLHVSRLLGGMMKVEDMPSWIEFSTNTPEYTYLTHYTPATMDEL